MASVRFSCDSSASGKATLRLARGAREQGQARRSGRRARRGDRVEVEVVADEDEEVTPLDVATDAAADFYAAQTEEVEEPVDAEFSADSLQLFLKDVGKVDL